MSERVHGVRPPAGGTGGQSLSQQQMQQQQSSRIKRGGPLSPPQTDALEAALPPRQRYQSVSITTYPDLLKFSVMIRLTRAALRTRWEM